jgi:hypothetical protein
MFFAFLLIITALVIHADVLEDCVVGEELHASGKYIAEHGGEIGKGAVEKVSYIDPQICLIACSAVFVGALGMVILNIKLDSLEEDKKKNERKTKIQDSE